MLSIVSLVHVLMGILGGTVSLTLTTVLIIRVKIMLFALTMFLDIPVFAPQATMELTAKRRSTNVNRTRVLTMGPASV